MKTTIRYHHMPIRMAKIENKKQKKTKTKKYNLTISSSGKNAEQLAFSYTPGQKVQR